MISLKAWGPGFDPIIPTRDKKSLHYTHSAGEVEIGSSLGLAYLVSLKTNKYTHIHTHAYTPTHIKVENIKTTADGIVFWSLNASLLTHATGST